MNKVGISGYKGVSFLNRPRTKPWQAKISFWKLNRCIHIYVGEYETPELAYIARLKFIDSLK